VKKVIHKINQHIIQLKRLDIDLWQFILLLVALAIAVLCGGYALNQFSFMNPIHSAGLFLLEIVILAFYLIKFPLNDMFGENDDSGKGGFNAAIKLTGGLLLIILMAIITLLHLWQPKTSAGIGATINFFIVIALVVIIINNLKWQSQENSSLASMT